MKHTLTAIFGALITAAIPLGALGASEPAAVAISTHASADYNRSQLPNGAFMPETFAFGKGGIWNGAAKDETLDKVDFMEVAKAIAVPLSKQNYVSSRDPKATKLLVMVYWGATHVPEHSTSSIAGQNLQIANQAALAANTPQTAHFNPADSCAPSTMAQSSTTGYAIRSPEQIDMDNAMTGAMAAVAAEDHSRDLIDARNASLLGYDAAWDAAVSQKGTPLDFRRKELLDELEDSRYFVVLMAYDFQMMWKDKKPKLLWEARYSIRGRGNDFEKQLPAMTAEASKYFGQNSGGLVRKALPMGHVDIGEERVVAYGSAN